MFHSYSAIAEVFWKLWKIVKEKGRKRTRHDNIMASFRRLVVAYIYSIRDGVWHRVTLHAYITRIRIG